MTAQSLISKKLTTEGISNARDLLDFSVMTDLRKPTSNKFETGKTEPETPSKIL